MSDQPVPTGVIVRTLKKHEDQRGWLVELFRTDELPEDFTVEMAYLSSTLPGVGRGPHEHVHQTDYFVFFDGSYELHLWENRPGNPPVQSILKVGRDNPTAVIVPPGVVHGYRNVGDEAALVFNGPNKLYAGKHRQEPVDEIRHEADPKSQFRFE